MPDLYFVGLYITKLAIIKLRLLCIANQQSPHSKNIQHNIDYRRLDIIRVTEDIVGSELLIVNSQIGRAHV